MPISPAIKKKALVVFQVGLGVAVAFALLVTVTHGPAAAFSQADAESESLPPSDFLRRYRDVLKRQMERYHDVRADGKISGRTELPKRTSQGKDTSQKRPASSPVFRSFSLVRSGVNEKLHLVRTGGSAPVDGVAVNAGSHAFRVRRGTPGGPFMLDRSETKNETWKMTEVLRRKVLDAPYSPAGLREFPAYVVDPQFQVTQVVRTAGPEGPTIKFSFRYLPNVPKTKPNLEGWVRLEGASDWVIRDYELSATWWMLDKAKKRVESVAQHSGSILYKQTHGVPVPAEIRHSEHRKSGFIDESVYQIDDFQLGPTPAEEFTLAAYGLGDFERPTERATNRSTHYVVLFGATALVMSLVLAAIARFRRERPSPEPAQGRPA
jgi:hypothetical protein